MNRAEYLFVHDFLHGFYEIIALRAYSAAEHYRVRTDSISSNKLAQAKYHWKLYREIEGLGVMESAFYVGCWAFVKGTGIGLRRRKNGCANKDVMGK